jgi:hypothetical protein
MSTFFLEPGSTKSEIEQSINNTTRFVLIRDHYPIKIGSDIREQDWIHDLMTQYPDCLFINSVNRSTSYDNEMWFPFYFFQTIIDQYDWDADLHTPRQKTCNAVGGRTRISRTLLSFWLANNYPQEQLIAHFTENESLLPIQDIIRRSPYYKKTHLHPRKFLVNNWLDSFDDIPEKEIAKNYLLPKILSKSYISLSSEANGIELGTRLCGYTYQAYLGGNIILPIGNYEAIDVLEDLGFETFRDLFNFDSLKTDDLYKMSIGVLEDNRDILCDHEQIESFYLSNTARLKHNKRLISDREHFIEYFKPVIKHIKKALDLVPHDHPNFTRDLRHIGRALTWIKNFS